MVLQMIFAGVLIESIGFAQYDSQSKQGLKPFRFQALMVMMNKFGFIAANAGNVVFVEGEE
jgi:hypothetical protein